MSIPLEISSGLPNVVVPGLEDVQKRAAFPYLVGVSGRLFPAKFEENGSRSELHQSLDHNFMTLKGSIQVNVLRQVSNPKEY